MRSAFPDIELTIEDIFSVDDKVGVRWIATGTHKGEGLGVPPSSRSVRIPGSTVVRIANGKIVEG
jgi:predicted ester cyclase